MGAVKEPTASLYQVDFHAWIQEQAARLKRREFAHLDVPNLIEEIEALGRSDERELESRLAQLLMHLLKWQHQWIMRSKSWSFTIREQRRRVEMLLSRMPSLRPKVDEFLAEAYSEARLLAERETGLSITTFPADCPYTADQVLEAEWLPTT